MSSTSPLVLPDTRVSNFPAPVATSEAGALLSMIERASRDPSTDIVKMRELFALRKEILDEENKRLFTVSMNAAQAEMTPIATNMTNPVTHSDYASYDQLDRAIRPIYTKHGFSISFNEADSPKAEHVRVICYVAHSSGYERTYHTDMPADGKGAKGGDVMTKTHAVGAAKSYGKRYIVRDLFNLAIGEEDVDGNDARPELPVDVVTVLKEAAKEGSEALTKCFKGLAETTRARIVADYSEEWGSLKADAAKVKSPNAAMDLAHRMRAMMNQDKEEFEIARQIEEENARLNTADSELLQKAWSTLQSHERSAWKEWLTYREKHGKQRN